MSAGGLGNAVRPRHVLHVRSSRGLAGPERHLLELLPGLARQGIGSEVAVLYRRRAGDPERHPLLDELADAKISAWQIGDDDRWGREALRELGDRVRGGGFAALHGHDPKSDWVIARAARGGRRRSGPPLRRLATVHLHTRSTLLLRLYRRIDLRLLQRCDGVVAVSAAVGEELARALSGRGVGRLRVIPNGIDGDAIARRAAAGLPQAREEFASWEAATVLLAAGRLTRQKGIDVLLGALARVLTVRPGLVVAVAGDGQERRALERRVVHEGLGGRVRFLGERRDLPSLLAAADGFVLSSRAEGLPYALLEAMALGVPVVATAVGGVPEALEGGRAGRLVPAEDPVALAEGILWLAGRRDEAAACARRARERVGGPYSASRMARETAELYREALG